MNNILFLIVISIGYIFPLVVSAELYPTFSYPSFTKDNKILYFNQYDGKIIELNIQTQDKKDISNIIPASASILSISPEQSKTLLYIPNVWFRQYEAPFFDKTRKVYDNQWWIYDFNTRDKKILSDKMNLATWYSENEIIYVFDNKDISIAPVSNLNDFKILYSPLPSTVDTNKQIIANEEHQIIPLVDGYLVGNKKKFTYQKSNNYQISANPKLNYFLEYNNSQLKVFDWDSKQVGKTISIDSKKTFILNNDTIIVLSPTGRLTQYNLQGQEQSNILLDPIVTDIYVIGQSENELLINQSNQISLYNLSKKEQGTMLIATNTPAPNNETNPEPGKSNTTGNTLLLVGGLVFLIAGAGLFIWKLRRR